VTEIPLNTPADVPGLREFQNVYSPGSLLGVYAAAVRTPVEGRMVLARGIFQVSQGNRVYGDYYYDAIKSVYESRSIKSKISALLRNKLEHGQVYLFKGYIEKKISFSSIELLFVVDEVLQKEENDIPAEDLRRFQLMQQKIARGFRDLESLVKERFYRNEEVRLVNIYGHSAIVNKDFEKGLAEASARFRVTEHRCSFGSKTEIVQTLNALSGADVHAVALVRGGGDAASLDLFNDPDIGAAGLKLTPVFVTALGHTVNETLADKLADKKFALPHDYGSSLRQWVEEAAQEQARSKSIFIEQVKADLSKTFTDQIRTLQTQLETRNKEFISAENTFRTQLEQHHKDRAEALLARDSAFAEQAKTMGALLKSKEETSAQLAKRVDEAEREKEKLEKMVSDRRTASEMLLWLVAAALAGLAAGALFI
jgi:exodeoxyribonuclease VII large subunit